MTGDADLPETGDVHHVLGELLVHDVPLLCEERVCDAKTGTNGGGGDIWSDGGRGTFSPLTWALVLEQVDGGEEAAGTAIAGLDGGLCADGIVAGKNGVAVWRGVLWGTKEPCVGEVADLADELEGRAELGDALGEGGGGVGGVVVEKEVVERQVIAPGGDGAGGDKGGEGGEGDDERVSGWHQHKGGDHVSRVE